MSRIKLFENFNQYKDIYQSIIDRIPDSDIPSETNIIEEIHGHLVYTEGWCERCFSNYDLDSREEMVNFARQSTESRLKQIPNKPQYWRFRDKKLVDSKFIELPDNSVNYALSIGIYN